jgi:predicted RNA-binding Zn ribbon-like protein
MNRPQLWEGVAAAGFGHRQVMSILQEQPAGRGPAPGPLELVQAFVNTNDIEGRRDALSRPEAARTWLAAHGLLEPHETVSEAEFLRLLDVREALRALALANNGLPLDEDAVRLLNEAAARSLAPQITAGGWALRSEGSGVHRALGHLLAAVFEAMADGSWPRLKSCRRDVCRWVFYDHSSNRSSSWCAMAICGNRAKTRAYRRRRKQA